MKLTYRIVSLIEWTAISYFAIPESIFRGSRIQFEEWISDLEASFAQITLNTLYFPFSPICLAARQPVNKFSCEYKFKQH
jgi:hypothetical protein